MVALSSVGTKDALLDDTLFIHGRWIAARNEAELAIYPGGARGFTLFPSDLSKSATPRMDVFPERRFRLNRAKATQMIPATLARRRMVVET